MSQAKACMQRNVSSAHHKYAIIIIVIIIQEPNVITCEKLQQIAEQLSQGIGGCLEVAVVEEQ